MCARLYEYVRACEVVRCWYDSVRAHVCMCVHDCSCVRVGKSAPLCVCGYVNFFSATALKRWSVAARR